MLSPKKRSKELEYTLLIVGGHRTYSSLVSQMCDELGVVMGDDLLGANPYNPWGHWEDRDWMEFNVRLLEAAGGDWLYPPTRDELAEVFPWYIPRVRFLVAWKDERYERWGFKDPRLCLTAEYLKPWLPKPLKVVVPERPLEEQVDSLLRRAQGTNYPQDPDVRYEDFKTMVHEYQARQSRFLRSLEQGYHSVDGRKLMKKTHALGEIEKLCDYLELGNPRDAYECIHFKEKE